MIMKKIPQFVIILALLILPAVSLAYSLGDPLVPCPGGKSCDWDALMTLINNVITFVLKYMVVPIAAIMFAYAGFLLVTAPGGEGKTKAKGIFWNTFLGLVFALAAWLIISTILAILGWNGSWIGF